MKKIGLKILSVILSLALLITSFSCAAVGSGYKAAGWGAPSGYTSADAAAGKYAVKVVFYGFGDTFSNTGGKIWLEYYSDNGAGSCSSPYTGYTLASDVWKSSVSNNAEMNVVLAGFPCHASCSFSVTLTGGGGYSSKTGGVFMTMYVYSLSSSQWVQIGNGSGVSGTASGGLFSGKTETTDVNASVRVNEDAGAANTTYSGMMPKVANSAYINCSDITVDDTNYLSAQSTVSLAAADQYGVSIVKNPDIFSINPSSGDNLNISDSSAASKTVTADYKTTAQSVGVSAQYTLGKPQTADGNYFDSAAFCSESSYKCSSSFKIINNTSSLTATPTFRYYKSNPENPSAPVLASLEGMKALKNTDSVEVPSSLSPVPEYFDENSHYTGATFGKLGTISSDTVFTASGYTVQQHNLKMCVEEPESGNDGKMYFKCDCGYRCGVKYDDGNYLPDKSTEYTVLPALKINEYTGAEIDYTKRGASLREEKSGSSDQYMRFAASAEIPKNVKIVDFGFILTRTKYIFGNEPVNNQAYNADDFKIGEKYVYDYPIYSEKGNYSVHDSNIYTFNLVVDIADSNWEIHYAARSYVSYEYNGTVVTVYDNTYSSRSVWSAAQNIYTSSSSSAAEKSYADSKVLSPSKSSLKMLSQSGRKIVDTSGNEVQLTGVNLGGWLLQEAWMTPVNKSDADKWGQWNTDKILEERFGYSCKEQLLDTYRTNWIDESDLDYLKNLGVNCVRVPFWYKNLLKSDDSLDWKTDSAGNKDFSYLDWIIRECGERNIYVILDLHGAMGFQSTNHSCGKCDSMKLFSSDESDKYIELNKALWKEIAARYKDNTTVAGYDILNEPLNNDDGKSDSDREKLIAPVYDAFYDAIREVDSNHLIIMEGIWNVGALPKVTEYGWTNVAYSCHNYNYQTSEIDDKISWYDSDTTRYSLIPSNGDYWVPMIVGEFQPGDILDYVCSHYNSAFSYTKKTDSGGWSWLTWSYKGTGSLASSTWFMQSGSDVADVNLEDDSFATILEKWGAALKTTNSFTENTSITKGSDSKSKGLSAYYQKLP